MADNTILPVGAGGDTVRDKDRAGIKTQIVGRDLNIGGATEVLETATALADATATPTVPGYSSYAFGFNGTTWDRLRSTVANGLAVDVTRLPSLPAGANTIGAISNANFAVTQATPANLQATVTHLPLSKGVQGANGVTTQDLKDAGRSLRTITLDSFAVAATTETLNTMSFSTDNGTLTTGTSYTVTAGKRFRVQALSLSLHTIAGNTTAVTVLVRMRVNNAGAAIVTSPLQLIIPIASIAAANQSSGPDIIPIPDGWEFVAGAGIGFTTTCPGFVATAAAPKVDITLIGYEY
jgi:hypothetical protein